MHSFKFLNLYIALFIILLTSCGKERSVENDTGLQGDVTVKIRHAVKNFPLNFTDQYTTDFGETYQVTSFKYYLHRIALVNSRGNTVMLSTDYFLVDETDSASKVLSFKAPQDTYTALNFTLGVDSTDNVSGAQSGALDPLNGMFWTWTTGYVMAKLEGVSPFVTGVGNNFSYHIGGFKSPYSAIKYISLPLTATGGLVVKRGQTSSILVEADLNTWFGRINPIKLAETPACHSPGELARKFADNYEGMFYIMNIE